MVLATPQVTLAISRPLRVRIPRIVLATLAEAGVDPQVVAAELGHDVHDRMSPVDADRIIGRCLAILGDPCFALRIGATLRPELPDAVGCAILAAPSFGEALRRVARYLRLLGGGTIELVPCTVVVDGVPIAAVAVRRRSFADADPLVERAHIDFDLAFLAALGRVSEMAIEPLAAGIRGPAPPHAAAYTDALRVCPQFDALYDELVFAADDLHHPLVGQTAELDAYFVDRAECILAECDVEPLVDRVRTAIHQALAGGGAPTIGAIARTLGISERTLQRQLADAGTRFAVELDAARRACVLAWLADDTLGLATLAHRAGFSGTAPLHRAVRRWVDMTPLEYRTAAAAAR